MELTRQEYPGLLPGLQPEQAINLLNDRVATIGKINVDIADWLQERRKIEESYAAALHKLARRPQQDGATTLGILQMPWQRIVSGVENMAQSHETLASKIDTDLETPLRQYATRNREMQSMSTIQGNIVSIAKDLNNAQQKADKLNAKGSNRIGDARSNVDDAAQQWESQAPYVFEQLQALDENRVNHLRDILTQFQTHELDQLERHRASAESCLNALLNMETADEIKTFAARVRGNPNLARRGSSATDGNRPASSRLNAPPAPPPPRNSGNDRTNSIPSQDRVAPLPEQGLQKSKISGLKRLGTVMGRRKSAMPPPPPSTSEKKKEKTRSFAPFRRGDSSRSFQDLESTGRDLTPVTSRDERFNTERTITSPTPDRDLDNGIHTNVLNGSAPTQAELPAETPPPLIPTKAEQTEITQPETQMTASPTAMPAEYPPRIDSFGPSESYTSVSNSEDGARNLMIRDQPIQEDESEAQMALSNMANQLRMQAQTSGINRVQGSVRGRRDVRNTMFFPTTPEILSPVQAATNLATPSTPTPVSAVPAPTSSTTSTDIATPIKRTTQPSPILEEQSFASDNQSIHSAHSLTNYVQHPEMHLPGLNASIIETVNTSFSDTGVTKAGVVGEVALAYVPTETSSSQEAHKIRLQNFHVLEKCAQNPNFVTPMADITGAEEQAGSYSITVSPIRRTTPTVAFKYQLHIDEANQSHFSPLLVTSAWQIIEGQASVILLYSLNPAFRPASTSQQVVLKNVTLTVAVDIKAEGAGKPVRAMMQPMESAKFRKKAGSVQWKFSELTVTSEQSRLLVRFLTEGGLAQKGVIDAKFELPDTTASGLSVECMRSVEADPFADEEERKSAEHLSKWEEVPTKRMLISGRYSSV